MQGSSDQKKKIVKVFPTHRNDEILLANLKNWTF